MALKQKDFSSAKSDSLVGSEALVVHIVCNHRIPSQLKLKNPQIASVSGLPPRPISRIRKSVGWCSNSTNLNILHTVFAVRHLF